MLAYKDKEGDIRQIGKELGVGYVVEGSVRKEGNRVRIVAQLIHTKTGDHVWADRFDKAGTDPWALQDELTGKIVGAMTGEFGAIRKADYSQAWGKDSTNLAEYDYYLRAESQLNLYTKEGLERSGEISRQGLQAFPGSPLLTVELAWSHWLKVGLLYSSDPQADLHEADRLVDQVLSNKNLSPQVARLAHWLHAWLLTLKRDHNGAVAEMNKAIAAAPYNAFTLTDAGSIFLQAGQPEKALELTDAAAARDPGLSWFFNYTRGFIFIVLGKNEDAVEALKTTEFADAPLQLAIAYMRLGRQADARAAVEKMLKLAPGATIQSWRQTWNFRDPSILDQAASDLARAGLPASPTRAYLNDVQHLRGRGPFGSKRDQASPYSRSTLQTRAISCLTESIGVFKSALRGDRALDATEGSGVSRPPCRPSTPGGDLQGSWTLLGD